MTEEGAALQRSRETAVELLRLFDGISRVTARALTAAERGEAPAVIHFLEQRQGLVSRAVELMARLASLATECQSDTMPQFALVVGEIVRAGRELEETDEYLVSRLVEHRQRVVDRLARVNTAELAHAAYSRWAALWSLGRAPGAASSSFRDVPPTLVDEAPFSAQPVPSPAIVFSLIESGRHDS